MYDPTDVSDELNRKMLETLSSVTARYKSGQISKIEFKTAVETIWNVTAGLINADFQDILDEALNSLKSCHPFTRRTVLFKNGCPIIVSWAYGTNNVVTQSFTDGKANTKIVKCGNPVEGLKKYIAVCKHFSEKGCVVLVGDVE